VYADELGVDLPYTGIAPETLFASLRKIASHPIRKRFNAVPVPENFAVAEFASPDAHPYHIGVYVETPDGPMILHNPKGGVVLEPVNQVKSKIKYWVYCG
jgi:hypothetical protein